MFAPVQLCLEVRFHALSHLPACPQSKAAAFSVSRASSTADGTTPAALAAAAITPAFPNPRSAASRFWLVYPTANNVDRVLSGVVWSESTGTLWSVPSVLPCAVRSI
jgi:hypothetical protein